MRFNIHKNPYGDNKDLFLKNSIYLQPNKIYCFTGCNGSGKSTLIREIIDNTLSKKANKIEPDFYARGFQAFTSDKKIKPIKYICFDKKSNYIKSEEDYFFKAAAIGYSSTGEGVMERFGNILNLIGKTVNHMKENETLFIFIDDADAGTSIDNIKDIVGVIDFIAKDINKCSLNYCIILTANSFELCKNYQCIDVNTFKRRKFKTYETYKKYVLESRERKDKRHE